MPGTYENSLLHTQHGVLLAYCWHASMADMGLQRLLDAPKLSLAMR